jgi:hypothetical protein
MADLFLDIQHNNVNGTTLVPIAQTTSANGTYVDLGPMSANMATAALMVGAVSGTQGTLDVKIQASTATNTGFADIPGATFTQVTTSGLTTGGAFQLISFQVPQRYVRAVGTMAGTFTSMLYGVSVFGQLSTPPTGNGGWVNEAGAS